jgi:hypothetical protein
MLFRDRVHAGMATVVLLGLGFVGIVAYRAATRPARLDTSESFTARLTLSGGFPPFSDTIRVASDGSIRRTVHEWGRSRETSSRVDPQRLVSLRAALESDAFAELAYSYGESVPDGADAYLEVTTPSGYRIIRCDGNWLGEAPEALGEVIDLMVALRDR